MYAGSRNLPFSMSNASPPLLICNCAGVCTAVQIQGGVPVGTNPEAASPCNPETIAPLWTNTAPGVMAADADPDRADECLRLTPGQQQCLVAWSKIGL